MREHILRLRGDSPRSYDMEWVQEELDAILKSKLEGMHNMAFIATSYWILSSFYDKDVVEMYESHCICSSNKKRCLTLAEKVYDDGSFDIKYLEESCSHLAYIVPFETKQKFSKIFEKSEFLTFECVDTFDR